MIKSSADKNNPEGTTGVCKVAVIPIRKEPQEQSEMISQLLFGEYFIIEKIIEKWLKITTRFDHFEGWIDRKFFHEAIVEKEMEYPMQPVLYSRIAEIEMPDGSLQLIPAGSSLPCLDMTNREFIIGNQKFRIRPLFDDILHPSSQKVYETARQYMNTPYLWGGRSVFGFDCSGFIQTVHKIHGIPLGRETIQQVLSGQVISSLKNTIPGDLAFFCNDEGRVNHVGMILAHGEIIHCSGWVRVDRLDEKGIFSSAGGIHTHLLKEVRRVTAEL
jgi:gamma-D-glutamyl-L-lysine dipeptidyl-peptidase